MKIQRHKLSLSIEYVSTWSIQDALRELYQNCLDHGEWSWEYKQETLRLISKDVSLDKKTILLGHSTKREDSSKLGTYGEGFKLAMLVLARLGHKPYILTGTDSWEAKLINSRTYQTQQLVFDIHQDQPESKDIIFVVPGITNEIFDELQNRNLHVRAASVGWHTKMGHILSEDYAGKVFVKGLWVCDIQGMKHGYDFKPDYITLDRDRRVVRDFDLQWRTCQMWQETEEFDYILTLIKDEAPDVKYLDSFDYSHKQGLADKASDAFIDEHGPDAVPVTCQYDIERAKEEGHEKIVMVPQVTKQLLTKSENWYYPAPKIVRKTPREMLLDFSVKYSESMGIYQGPEAVKELNELIEKARTWSC